MAATFTGMAVYVAIAFKLHVSAPPADLAGDQLIMSRIALWGPIILFGLASATLSSALGSILVAPRTLQALAADNALPIPGLNPLLARGVGPANEPRNGTLATGVVALVVVALGNVDVVARLISMFFMVTYGALCAISALEHFAARPSYRPSFRSKWYISLFGALMCFLMMFQMDPLYAVLAIGMMFVLYRVVRAQRGTRGDDLAEIFLGVLTQGTRYVQVRLQDRRRRRAQETAWRPAIIMLSGLTFERRSPLSLLRWLCHRYGFGTYLHYIQGPLDEAGSRERRKARILLDKLRQSQRDNMLYMDVIVSPSLESAVAQALQVPGITGLENNSTLHELSIHDPPEVAESVLMAVRYSALLRKNVLVLRHGDVHFGERRSIHIWLTNNDGPSANLMVLLAYIILGHPDWEQAEINVFAALPRMEVGEQREQFTELVASGRLPISEKNIRFLPVNDLESYRYLVERHSTSADLVIMGVSEESLSEQGASAFQRHPSLSDVLFVRASQDVQIE
jgi:hypothetical protein